MSKLVIDDGAKDTSLGREQSVAMAFAPERCAQVLGLEDVDDAVVEAPPKDEALRLALGPGRVADLSRHGELVIIDVEDD